MANIYVYNNQTGGMEYYTLAESDAMPYNIGRTLTVNEFGAVPCKYDVDYKAGDGGFQHNKKCVGEAYLCWICFQADLGGRPCCHVSALCRGFL